MSLTRRSLVPLLLAAAPLALQAQDLPSRFGLGFAFVAPQGDWKDTYDSGWNVGLHVHFNREGNHEQRLRIDFIGLKEFKESGRLMGADYTVKANAAGVGVGYDWLFHFDGRRSAPGAYALIGVGGIRWTEEFTAKSEPSARNPYHVVDSQDFTSFALTVGLGVRLSRNIGLEVRHTEARTDKIRWFGESERFVDAGLSNTSVGITFRF